MQKKETKSSWKQIPMIMLLIMTIMKKGNKEPLETNPYDCATNNDNHAKKGNKESLEPNPYDCATDNGKLLED